MDSPHFYLVILDVEGRVVKFNHSFQRGDSNPTDSQFCDFVSPRSASEFSSTLDLMLGKPQIRRHLMLEHPQPDSADFSKVWWEFSVVTTPDMDVSGILGIGADLQLVEQDMPWQSLVDVLGFGKIVLDSAFHIQSWDEKISEWFDPERENWKKRALMETPTFQGMNQLRDIFSYISNEAKPKCFLLKTNPSNQYDFAGLLTVSNDGFDFFLVPKERASTLQTEKCMIPSHVLSSLQGAVFVLDSGGKLLQQNEAAKKLGFIWNRRAYSEGFSLTFPIQSSRFTKLLRAIDRALKGLDTDLEVRMLMSGQESAFWEVSLRPIDSGDQSPGGVLIHAVDLTSLKAALMRSNRENERLRELALSPSHILRGPLSSMIGLLELIDAKQLDKENQNLFRYLKPLTKELDQTIRQHAKKMSAFG